MHFCAVRGEMTKRRVEQMLGRTLDIPTGDPGILASDVLEQRPEKRYDIGIIPHLCDLRDPMVEEVLEKYGYKVSGDLESGREKTKKAAKDGPVRFINVKDEPLEVIEEIAKCRYILSSSLHGLIVADSFGIPNMHIVFGDRLLGDGYKFDDYYSAYGIEHYACDLRTDKLPELSEIEGRYKIQPEMAAGKKKSLREAFPFSAIQEEI